MKKRTIYITLFLIFIIGVISLIGTFAIDSTITEGISSKADYLFNITLGDRTNREIVIPSYDSKIVDIKISNPNDFNMSYLLYLEGVNSNLSIINISNNEASGVLNSKTNTLIKVFIQNNSSSDITTSIKDIVGFEKETLDLPSNSTAINKGPYYKAIVKSNNNTYGKVKPNIKLSTKNGTVKYTLVPNTGYQYKSTTCNGAVSNNILTISNITSNTTCEVVFEPKNITVSLDLAGGVVETTYTEPKEHIYTVPYNGTYKLETWGAEGGATIDGTGGGYGGYSTGTILLNSGDILYVNVGGQGSRTSSGTVEYIAGGYNGGGSTGGQACCNRSFGSGGGATHIATKSGLLSSLSSNLSDILIVSGGGGGAYYGENVGTYGLRGGSGGGYIGNSGAESTETDNQWCAGLGGTQTAGGAISTNCSKSSDVSGGTITGSFGQGGENAWATTGGGGGFYGGSRSGHIAPGGGGSGYIGNSKLSNKYMYCYYCATSDATSTKTYSTTNISGNSVSNYVKTGNGAAKITLVDNANYKEIYNTKYSNLPTPTRTGYTFEGWYTGENGTGTRITSDTVLTNENNHTLYAKWRINNVTVTYDGNMFSAVHKIANGLTIDYDPSTSYLTLNGTPTGNVSLNKLSGLSFVLNEQYTIKTTYVSGSFKDAGSTGGCFVIDVKTSTGGDLSTRNNVDLGFTTNYGGATLTISSVSINEGNAFEYWIWFNTPTDWTFTNYKVKIDVTKVESKTIQRGQKYGTMPTPIRTGYTFDGWYTGENGAGTRITSDTVLTNTKDHTLYANWNANLYAVSFNLNGGTLVSTYTYPQQYTYTVPYNGAYKLETWGASGGSVTYSGSTYRGGYGGYSTGTIWLSAGTILYINVGGMGASSSESGITNIAGGYNGGGYARQNENTTLRAAGGGGATHIATAAGLLSSLSSNRGSILIVSGGGAGAYGYNPNNSWWLGNSGGGYIGGYSNLASAAGTQSGGFSFGQASDTQYSVDTTTNHSGGGGGYYGGYAYWGENGAGGGSGYIGNSQLTDKYMYCYSCATSNETATKTYATTNISDSPISNYAKNGNGAAMLSLVGLANYSIKYGQKYGTLPTITRYGYVFDGWYTGANGTGTKITNETILSITSNHTLYANWTISDTSAPTCSLSANASTISASASDNVGIAYQGWSSSYSGGNEYSKGISVGTHTYYVKDTAGNTNTCSISISGQSETSVPYTETCAAYANYTTVYSGSCRCSKKATGGTSYVEGYCNPSSGCSCPGGTSISSNSCIGTKKVTSYYCPGNGTVSGSTCIYTKYKTVYGCPSGYTGISGSSLCYKY